VLQFFNLRCIMSGGAHRKSLVDQNNGSWNRLRAWFGRLDSLRRLIQESTSGFVAAQQVPQTARCDNR
jgi:hypothetical protein